VYDPHLRVGDYIRLVAALPLNLDKEKTMRLIVDIPQIVGQVGIAIAAANTVLEQ
jgi:hypothetical protein